MASLLSFVKRAAHTINNDVIKPVEQAGHTVYSGAAAPVRLAAGEISHNNQAIQNARQSAPTPLQFGAAAANLGTFALGGPLARGAELGIHGAVGFAAPKVAPIVVRNVAAGLGEHAAPQLLKNTVRFGAPALTGAGLNSAFAPTGAVAQGIPIKQAVKTIPQAAAVGGALGLAGPVVGAGAKGVGKVVKAAKPLNQSGKLRLPSFGGQNLSYSSANGITKVSGKRDAVLTKLNQAGAVGKNVPSEEELQYAHAFKVSPEQARKELVNLNEQQSTAASRQMKKPQGVGLSKGVKDQLQPKEQFKRGAKDNTNLNPMKVDAPVVKAGDYGQARLRPSAVSRPIEFSAGQTVNSLKKLSSGDKASFWKAVENPESIKSPALKEAVSRWNDLSNRVHATSQALGGNTNYVSKYARHNWDLSKPEDAARYQELVNKRGGAAVDSYDFSGVNSQNRAFSSITEGEAAGFKLKNPGNPAQDVVDYANSASGTLRKQALAKAITEADMHSPLKNRSFDLGNGQTIPMSEDAIKAIKAFEQHQPSANKAVRGVRTANAAAKTTILSGGQFHPINISVLRAGPSTALAGHPIAAAKGVARTFRPLLPGGKGAVDRVMQKALNDGMVEKAAKIGAPYGQAGYNVEGTALKSGVGHKLVFERQMPMMHDQVVRSVIKDLEKKGISLDSEEARQAGIAANATMGFINKEALNISPRVRQGMSDLMLASQFTPSKVVTLGKVAKGGVAGKYARSDVASNVAAATALITGVGYALGQKSDSIRDSLLRALVNPGVPTPMKDKKGNNIEMRIPLTYTGEISKILGVSLDRQKNGHLGVKWEPNKAVSAHSGLAEWLRSRLSPVASTAVKLKTNTNFADKPLYDPNAPAGTKAIQAGTTIGQGLLPIGTQGIPNTEFVKKRVPSSARDILEANTPGSNPILKGAASSIGFSPRTDQTVGKGLTSSQYFNALDKAGQGLNDHEKAVLELYAGSKKNPVTGKYDVKSNVNDTPAKARALLDQPKVIDNLITMNSKLQSQGQKVDPLWSGNKDQITKVLQYQAMPPGGADRTHWYNQNKDWYSPLADARSKFFGSLPKGDPNKPTAPIEFPKASPDTAANQQKASLISQTVNNARLSCKTTLKFRNSLMPRLITIIRCGLPKVMASLTRSRRLRPASRRL
jgi:hypothetical protein